MSIIKWFKYKPHKFPPELIVDGATVPRPVVVRYENGHEEDDYIFNGALVFFCETSCTPIYGRIVKWRYKYTKAEFFKKVYEERERRKKRK